MFDLLINLCLALSVLLIFFGIFGPPIIERPKLPKDMESTAAAKKATFLASILPTQKLTDKLKLTRKLSKRLDIIKSNLSALEYFNMKLLIVAGLILVSVIALGGKFQAKYALILFVLGYFVPDFWLAKKVAKRKYEISRIFPETVDLLNLCMHAGLDFTNSMKWIIEKNVKNPLIEELTYVLEEIKWGKSRGAAIKAMADRLEINEISSFAQTLIQAERFGTPISETFDALSEDMRLQRFHRGERAAIRAPFKILIPLIFFILPVVGIIVAGPIILQFMQGNILKF